MLVVGWFVLLYTQESKKYIDLFEDGCHVFPCSFVFLAKNKYVEACFFLLDCCERLRGRDVSVRVFRACCYHSQCSITLVYLMYEKTSENGVHLHNTRVYVRASKKKIWRENLKWQLLCVRDCSLSLVLLVMV